MATARTEIDAPAARVWDALTDPVQAKEYMFGAEVESDFEPGSAIVWRGEWEGKPFEDKGEIVAAEPCTLLEMTHFSGASGKEDDPRNYHHVRLELSEDGGRTSVRLTQDGSKDAEEAKQASQNWQAMLDGLRKVAEGRHAGSR
jgi:uncharacterized protein YndB with AHSA1/START domain